MANPTRSKSESKADKPTQHDRFVEAARELGCDEDEAAFDEKLKVIARQKPTLVRPYNRDSK